MKKMKTIPFDHAMAKEILEGRRQGEIVTRDGNLVEILTFDADLRQGSDTQPAEKTGMYRKIMPLKPLFFKTKEV